MVSSKRKTPLQFMPVVLLVWTFAPSIGVAQMYIAPEAIYTYPDQSTFRKDEQSLGIGAGALITPQWSAALEYDDEKLARDVGGVMRRKTLLFDNQYAFGSPESSRPYLSAGAGASRIPSGGNINVLPVATLGAGYTLHWPNARSWDLQTEVRGRYAYDDNSVTGSRDVIDAQALLRLRYGRPSDAWVAPEVSAVPEAVAVVYKAGPGPVPVVTSGPAGQSVRLSVRDDRDQDGVSNSRDRCPSTIKGVSVDPDGCMISSHGP